MHAQVSRPVVREGDTLLCDKGHAVCTARLDIHTGWVLQPEHFDWHQQAPQHGERMACRICGEAYMDYATGGALPRKLQAAPVQRARRAPELDTEHSYVWLRPDGSAFLSPKGH